jgi:hypothetical protein
MTSVGQACRSVPSASSVFLPISAAGAIINPCIRGNCISTPQAYPPRERKVKKKPTLKAGALQKTHLFN